MSATSVALPRRIAVTGAAGYLGRVIVDALAREGEVEQVLAIDVRSADPNGRSPKVTSVAYDVREDLGPLVLKNGVDAIIHLAYPLEHQRSFRRLRPYCIDVTHNVMRAAVGAKVQKILLCSSTSVYGAYPGIPDRDHQETDEPRPNRGYHYAIGKVHMEAIAQDWRSRLASGVQLVVFRPSIVIGPRATNYLVNGFFGFDRVVRGTDPRIQLLHEDDLSAAVLRLLHAGRSGTYNVAPDDAIRRSELHRLLGMEARLMSYARLKATMALRWALRWRDPAPVPPAMLDLLSYSWVATSAKLKQDTGYMPRYGSTEALMAFFEEYRRRSKRPRAQERV